MGKYLVLAALLAGCLHAHPGHVEGGVLGRVVIYRNGVAFYERKARVVDGAVTIHVPRERVDDFLKSLTVVDPETRKPLAVTVPRQQAGDSSYAGGYLTMTLATEERKRGEVLLTYVTEAPAWKPSYRVVLGDKGKVMLEGWAIVDNTTTEDWKGVLIGVGASSALAFRYDLWSVRTIDRDLLEGDDRMAIAPPSGVSPYATSGAEEVGSLDATEVRVSQRDTATGHIGGKATDKQTHEELPGVTIVVSTNGAPEQTTITDDHGNWTMAVAPGTYTVQMFYLENTLERSNVLVQAGGSAVVNQALPNSAAKGETIEIADSVPTIDPTSTSQGITIDQNYTRNIPVPGRTFDATMGSAAGSQVDPYGVTFSGSESVENQYIVNGVNTGGSSYEAPPPPPPPTSVGDQKVKQIAARVLAAGQAVVVEVAGASSDSQGAASRGEAVRASLIDAGVPANRIRVVTKLADGSGTGVRVLAVAQGQAAAGDQVRDLGPDAPVGESHFMADRPLTVNAGTSAMVAMVRGETTGGVAYLYDPISDRGDLRYAFKSVRLDNPTGDTLEPGPVTVYGEGRFIGEGITEPVPPHASVVVPFALDKQIVVSREGAEEDRIAKLVTVERGVVTAEVQHRRATTFTLTSRLSEPATVYVRHRLESGWTLVDAPSKAMAVGDSQLFAVTVNAGDTTTVTITEATPMERTLNLASDDAMHMMAAYVEEPTTAPELSNQVNMMLATRRRLAELDDKLETLQEEIGEYRDRAAELTIQIAALKSVKSGDALMKTLRTKLADIAGMQQTATIAAIDTREARMLARVELQNQLADLHLPDATRSASR